MRECCAFVWRRLYNCFFEGRCWVIMNYLKEVLNYYFKNLGWLALFVCIPVLFFGVILHPFKMFEFLIAYPNGKYASFGDFWNAIFDTGIITMMCFVAGFVVLVVAISLLLGAVEKHFKTGKVSLVNDFSLNSNLLGVAKLLALAIGICLLINFIALLLIFVMHFLFASHGVAIWVNIVFAYLVVFISFAMLIRVFSLASLTCVEMLLNGSPFKNSFFDALSSLDRAGWSLRFLEILLGVLIVGIMLGASALGIGWLGEMIGLLLLVPIECVMGMIVFFDHNELTRFDKKRWF